MRRLVVAFCLLVSIGPVQAEDAEQSIRSVNQAFEKAWSTHDMAAIEKLWSHAPYVYVVHPSSKTPELGWEKVAKSFETQMSRYSEFTVAMAESSVHVDGNTAFVVGLESFTGKRLNGETAQGNAIGTRGFEKKGDQWLLIFHQATPVR